MTASAAQLEFQFERNANHLLRHIVLITDNRIPYKSLPPPPPSGLLLTTAINCTKTLLPTLALPKFCFVRFAVRKGSSKSFVCSCSKANLSPINRNDRISSCLFALLYALKLDACSQSAAGCNARVSPSERVHTRYDAHKADERPASLHFIRKTCDQTKRSTFGSCDGNTCAP